MAGTICCARTRSWRSSGQMAQCSLRWRSRWRENPVGPSHGVQRLLDGAVAGGVHRALKSLPVRTTDEIGGGTRL